MKTLAIALATTALTATAAVAGGVGAVDQNGDNFASKAELTAVYPTLTSADFREIDVNDDNRISNSELARGEAVAVLDRHVDVAGGVRAVAELDADGSGFVSEAELAAAYPGLTAFDFNEIDTNNDNRVSSLEIYDDRAQTIVSRYDEGASNIVVSLDVIDVDGSGFASLAELSSQYTGLSATEFSRIDTNKDNRVSFTELYNANAVEVLGQNL